MLGFYIVGLIFRAVLVRLNTKEPEEEVKEESEPEEAGEEDGVKTVDEEENQA